jgi:hypothetical protein
VNGQVMIAYKLLSIKKTGKLYPLFINKKEETKIGKWLKSKCFPTKGFAVRQGWHCCFLPVAPHLKEELANGEQRVWVEIEVKNYTTYSRPESQGGTWILADMIKVNRVLTRQEVEKIREKTIAKLT